MSVYIDKFEDLSKTIFNTFLPALFDDDIEEEDPRHKLAALPVKQAGLALADPARTASSNFTASSLVVSHLLAALKGTVTFSSDDHTRVGKEVKLEIRERRAEKELLELNGIMKKLPCSDRRTILRGKSTGQWLSVLPSTVNGTELSAQEFRDSLQLRYARSPSDLQANCDGCGSKFSVRHALECKNGGLVIGRHDEIRDELHFLATLAFKPSMVRDEPKIHTSSPIEGANEQSEEGTKDVRINFQKNNNDDRGDILVRGFWTKGTDCIIDVRVTDTDAKSNRSKDPMKVLETHEKEKKRKYLEPCLKQRRHFTPFVVSVDGLLGKEAEVFLNRLAGKISEKWGKPYSEVCGFVRARMSIAIIRATHLCLRGSRVPTSKMSYKFPQWEDSAGLGLFRR
jgi:hypothetical protein